MQSFLHNCNSTGIFHIQLSLHWNSGEIVCRFLEFNENLDPGKKLGPRRLNWPPQSTREYNTTWWRDAGFCPPERGGYTEGRLSDGDSRVMTKPPPQVRGEQFPFQPDGRYTEDLPQFNRHQFEKGLKGSGEGPWFKITGSAFEGKTQKSIFSVASGQGGFHIFYFL